MIRLVLGNKPSSNYFEWFLIEMLINTVFQSRNHSIERISFSNFFQHHFFFDILKIIFVIIQNIFIIIHRFQIIWWIISLANINHEMKLSGHIFTWLGLRSRQWFKWILNHHSDDYEQSITSFLTLFVSWIIRELINLRNWDKLLTKITQNSQAIIY